MEKKTDISVVLVTYNSDLKKTLETIKSIISQKNVLFDLVIADDGSQDNHRKDVEEYLFFNSFSNYKFIANPKNQGTVKNLLSGVVRCNGKYVKGISPGDYLYDVYTLRDIVEFMEKNQALCAFGGAVYYSDNNSLTVHNKKSPVSDYIYTNLKETYDYDQVKRAQFFYKDFILGAVAIFEKNILVEGLRFILNRVIYAEDTIIQLIAYKNIMIYKMPQYIFWYEYGSGISTNSSKDFMGKVFLDNVNFRKLLIDTYGESKFLERAYFEFYAEYKKNITDRFKVKLWRILDPYRRKYKYKNKKLEKNYVCTNYIIDNYKLWKNI